MRMTIVRKAAEMGRVKKIDTSPLGDQQRLAKRPFQDPAEDEGQEQRAQFKLQFAEDIAHDPEDDHHHDVGHVVFHAVNADGTDQHDDGGKDRVGDLEQSAPITPPGED